MKHFVKIERNYGGHRIQRLVDPEGDPIPSFDEYSEALVRMNYKKATIQRYQDTVAVFLDYLVEAGVFGQPATQRDINNAIDSYFPIRLQADKIRDYDGDDDLYAWAKPIVVKLKLRQLNEPGNAIAAINHFLRVSETVAREDWEVAERKGLPRPSGSYNALIRSVDGFRKLSNREAKALRQNSFLAQVATINTNGIKVPRGLRSPKNTAKPEFLDFPIEYLHEFISRGPLSYRDKALYLVLSASGIRTSEAMNLRLQDIDTENRRIIVDDPYGLRWARDFQYTNAHRFKGRTVSETYLIPHLADAVFDAIAEYVRKERIAGVNHDYLFQTQKGKGRGQPMHMQSDSSRIQAFDAAVQRSGIPVPDDYKYYLHSFRHMYGVFMLNYLPVPGGYGLQLHEVQQCMGHASIESTKRYARENPLILQEKFRYANKMVMENFENIQALPTAIAKRLRDEIKKLEGRSK